MGCGKLYLGVILILVLSLSANLKIMSNQEVRFNKEPLTEIFNFRTTESLMGFLRNVASANQKSINTTLNEILIPIEKKYKSKMHQVRKPIIKSRK